MEEVVDEHLGEEDLHAAFREHAHVHPGGVQLREVAHRYAVDAFQREHLAGTQVAVHHRHVQLVGIQEVLAQLHGVRRFGAQVELVQQGAPVVGHDLHGAQALEVAAEGEQLAREPREQCQVCLHDLVDARTDDLHHDVAAVGQPRRVHLGHRGGGEGVGLEVREHLVHRPAQGGLDAAHRFVRREGRHGVLQLRELVGDVVGQQVAARGQHLPELDEHGAERLEREP